jgi:hypothetical protein
VVNRRARSVADDFREQVRVTLCLLLLSASARKSRSKDRRYDVRNRRCTRYHLGRYDYAEILD